MDLNFLKMPLAAAGGRVLFALVTLILGSAAIKLLVKIIPKQRFFGHFDKTGAAFALNSVKIGLYVLLAVSIIGILGIPIASIITVLASAGVAIGLALQGALGNFAGGIMIMLFRPFSVGDYIKAAGSEGTVKDVTAFYTVLMTADGKEITVPNGSLMNANVENYSIEPERRVDVEMICARDEDVGKVLEILLGAARENPKVLGNPEPFAALSKSTGESLCFVLRAWVKNEDYWDVYYELTGTAASALSKAGVKAPAVRVVSEAGKARS